MPKQDINNQADETAGPTESQVKFIKVLKPASAAPATQDISGDASSIAKPTTAGETNTSVSSAPRPGGGCIPVSGMHR